uniref:solute carrier family 35 member F1-like n=1 Tax=Erigeron canadensis TaxID=72917 RepID=UPI001CB956ED|nr:solute carrier family 35 member F1-like [Erigeron canadensis]
MLNCFDCKQISWYWYVILGFVDVQGSFLVNKAYQFSSITSLTILGCMTVVWVIILTWLFLGTKYSVWQYLGSAVCVTGLCLVVFSDSGVGGGGGSNPVLGDVLVIGGTIFFALSNVGEEFCVKKAGRVEAIAMFGLFGTLVSLVEIAIFDKKNLEVVTWSPEVILNFVGFGISGFMFGSITPLVLQASGATLLNLSLDFRPFCVI